MRGITLGLLARGDGLGWYFIQVQKTVKHSGDYHLLLQTWPTCFLGLMVLHRLLHELVRMLRASPHLTQIVAVRVWQPSKRHSGGEDLLCLSMATVAVVRRCSVLPTFSDILVWLGRHLVCGRIS